MWKNRKAQSTVEYAVLIAVVVGALLAMQIYVKRGAMGKLRSSTDQIGDQFTPDTTTYTFTNSFGVTRSEKTNTPGDSTSKITTAEGTSRTGSESVNTALDAETLF